MSELLSGLTILLVLLNIYLLSSSRIRVLISAVAVQGVLLGLSPFLIHAEEFSLSTLLIGLSGLALKGVLIPLLLFRALRGVDAYREHQPHVGYTLSIIVGVVITFAAFWTGAVLPQSSAFPYPGFISLAIAMAASGLFLIIARRIALTQVIGYLVLENGIYAFGVSLSGSQSPLVEMGALLDLLVGIFVMGIVVYHINREFDSISTESLQELKE
jgi:hydrogenase-4 component E